MAALYTHRMGRHKTISDDAVLQIARGIFRERGHTASTRDIAEAAGISEAILYQRFGSKNDLFFQAMRPVAADVAKLLGDDSPEHALPYLRRVIVRIGRHFAEVIPVAVQVMMHPSFEPRAVVTAAPKGPTVLLDALTARIEAMKNRGQLRTRDSAVTARLLISLAHDWALSSVMPRDGAPLRLGELRELADAAWEGLRPDL